MSYPSQPSYPTNPYGQPQQQPPNQTNLWLIGGAVVAVLIVIMTVTLVILQRTAGSNDGAGGGANTESPSEEGPTDEPSEEEPTEVEPTEVETTESGGGGEITEIVEAVCDTYDLSSFETVMGESVNHDETSTSANSSGETGSLSCYYYSESYWTVQVYVDVTDNPEFNIGWVEDEQVTQAEDANYEVTDYTALGDTGYMAISDDTSSQRIMVTIAVQNIEIEVETTIDQSQHDQAAAIAMVEDLVDQAHTKFAGFVM